MTNNQLNALCQAAVLEGIPKKDERRLEQRCRHLIDHNGPEFLISIFKVLKEHTIANLDSKKLYHHTDGNVSVSWDHRVDAPKGPLKVIYNHFPEPEKRIRVIGALISSIKLETASEQQVNRFNQGILYNNRAKIAINLPHAFKYAVDKEIPKLYKHRRKYSASNLTASTLPVGTYTEPIAHLKKDLLSKDRNIRINAIAELHKQAVNQFYLAPPSSRSYNNDITRLSKGPSVLNRNNPWTIPSAIHMTPVLSREYEARGPHRFKVDELQPYVGTISFLQQAGGKLRTVCNINRFVNYTLDPFGKALANVLYKEPSVSVLNQDAGIQWAQEKLRDNQRLTSMDLSQATDKLDFRSILNGFSEEDKKEFPYFWRTLEYFQEMAESPLFSPDLDSSVQFQTGQPLGMSGSFQVLTLMNWYAGTLAAQRLSMDPNDSFRVVGDDFICLSEMKDEYSSIIEALCGETNAEKALESNNYGEFLSQLITRDKVIPMKPKYRPGTSGAVVDVEKSTISNIRHWYRLSNKDKSAMEILSVVSDDRLDNIPSVKGGSYRLKSQDRTIISHALSVVADWTNKSMSRLEISSQTVDLAIQERDPYRRESDRETDRRVYHKTHDGVVYDAPSSGPVHLEEGDFSPVVDKFDHKSHKRVDRDELTMKAVRHSFHKKADLVKKLTDDLIDGSPSDIEIDEAVVSTTDILIKAMDDAHYADIESKQRKEFRHAKKQSLSNTLVEPKDIPSARPKRPRPRHHDDELEF